MEKVYLRLLKPWGIYKAGDVVTVPAGITPERMIRDGMAERYTAEREFTERLKHGDDFKDSADNRTDKPG